jgi:hypothetical protein
MAGLRDQGPEQVLQPLGTGAGDVACDLQEVDGLAVGVAREREMQARLRPAVPDRLEVGPLEG